MASCSFWRGHCNGSDSAEDTKPPEYFYYEISRALDRRWMPVSAVAGILKEDITIIEKYIPQMVEDGRVEELNGQYRLSVEGFVSRWGLLQA